MTKGSARTSRARVPVRRCRPEPCGGAGRPLHAVTPTSVVAACPPALAVAIDVTPWWPFPQRWPPTRGDPCPCDDPCPFGGTGPVVALPAALLVQRRRLTPSTTKPLPRVPAAAAPLSRKSSFESVGTTLPLPFCSGTNGSSPPRWRRWHSCPRAASASRDGDPRRSSSAGPVLGQREPAPVGPRRLSSAPGPVRPVNGRDRPRTRPIWSRHDETLDRRPARS